MPTKPTGRMKGPEVIEEIDWLLDAQVHPALIADVLHKTPIAIEKLARRYGRADISVAFASVRRQQVAA